MAVMSNDSFSPPGIAIIGLSCLFPGASNYTALWDNLIRDKETISSLPGTNKNSDFVNVKPFLEDTDCFDAEFFKISSKEAALMDPHHRLLLQSAWQAFEDSGYLPNQISGKVGVFASSNFNTYQLLEGWFSKYWKNTAENPSSRFLAYKGNIQDTLASLLSYKMNLKGPSATIQTACSSALTALHLGCQSILLEESDMVLVGAAALSFPDKEGYFYEESMMLSKTGHCRSFDKDADGTVFGNGVASVVLKATDQALADGDYIYGTIEGSAINNDGSDKVSFSAPSQIGQQNVIEQALSISGIKPRDIAYIEAHGTGTIVGDPIEFQALSSVFQKDSEKKQFCGIGSVKTNLGHLDAASGMAGLIKVLLSLDRQIIPATLHYKNPNPELMISDSPFYVVDKQQKFPRGSRPRVCGLTSLGIGGTNAHVVIKEAPLRPQKTKSTGLHPFMLSANSKEQLIAYLEQIKHHLERLDELPLISDICFTLATSRILKPVRCLACLKNTQELLTAIDSLKKKEPSKLKIAKPEESLSSLTPKMVSEAFQSCVANWEKKEPLLDHPFFKNASRRRVPLPGYPFDKKRHWYDQVEYTTELLNNQNDLLEESSFCDWFSEASQCQRDEICLDTPLSDYHLDSMQFIALTSKLKESLKTVSPTIFFEHYSLRGILNSLKQSNLNSFSNASKSTNLNKPLCSSDASLAIIGSAGYYPLARSPDTLWEHLIKGSNLITEIPKDRWDHSLYYSPEKALPGKTYSKWGGFIDHIDMFDPLFFKMSPREAALLDPQERLFLQVAWNTLEDAGYSPKELHEKMGRNIGIYVGATYQEYQLYGVEEQLKNNPIILNGTLSSIANRVSYQLDLSGPSLVVDTMCSSSMTALYLACQDVMQGNIAAAFVGGANLTPHPNKYLQLAQDRMLSENGLCQSFGEGGNGYVPSEAVGCILIKRLEQAEKDHDLIRGVIRGVDINHGGRAAGFTVPNAQAQAEVIRGALKKSHVQADSISYVEAHGTGTALGDPIEIQGLIQGFSTKNKQSCSIGSIKSNLGHTEASAGILGLQKVLLQFQHNTLVPSIHSDSLNSSIDFLNTPFKIQQQLTKWTEDSRCPKFAAVSSFGAGGSNGHVILESYYPQANPVENNSDHLILLSAHTKNRLQIYAQSMANYLEIESATSLADIAFTLCVGRAHMEERVAFICSTKQDLINKFREISKQKDLDNGYFLGHSQQGSNKASFSGHATGSSNLKELAQAWVNGSEINWDSLFANLCPHPSRASLPTYPFDEQLCRFDKAPQKMYPATKMLHPLIHENISNASELAFKTLLSDQTEAIQDHKIDRRVLLPGAGYVEMLLFAAQYNLESGLKSNTFFYVDYISFLKPMYLDSEKRVIITSIIPTDSGADIEIWETGSVTSPIFSQGKVIVKPTDEAPLETGIKKVILSDPTHQYSKNTFYQRLKEHRFDYGPAYRTVESVKIKGNQVVIDAQIQDAANSLLNAKLVLNPILLDAALQGTTVFDFESSSKNTYVPYCIKGISLIKPLSKKVSIHILKTTKTEGATSRTYTITFFNEDEEPCLYIENFEEKLLFTTPNPALKENIFLTQNWVAASLENQSDRSILVEHLCATSNISDECNPRYVFSNDPYKTIDNIRNISILIKQFLKEQPEDKVFLAFFDSKEEWLSYPLVGLFKALNKEDPRFFGKVVLIQKDQDVNSISHREAVRDNHLVKYDPLGARFTESYTELYSLTQAHNTPLVRHNGVYIVTGGSGAIAKKCIEKIASYNVPCTIALLGRRSSYCGEVSISEASPIKLVYHTCDVTDLSQLSKVLENYPVIHGIFHLAATTEDGLFINKETQTFEYVMSPKVHGVLNIDKLIGEKSLDYMILFSSDSSVFGNIGQADYCAANGFLDGFAIERARLRDLGERQGLTKVINWGYWEEGGITLSDDDISRLHSKEGTLPIDTISALKCLEKIFYSDQRRVACVSGERSRILSHIKNNFYKEEGKPLPIKKIDEQSKKVIYQQLRTKLAHELKIAPSLILDNSKFDDFGVDSILSMTIISSLEKTFGELPKTLFFEYLDFQSLADYFANNHPQVFESKEKLEQPIETVVTESTFESVPSVTSLRIRSKKCPNKNRSETRPVDIAIIGVAGEYPKSASLSELWERLVIGENCIEEIPKDRFNFKDFFEQNTTTPGKTKSKWGGFLKNVHGFDPLFFRISKDEAIRLDPQERLFLQTAWHAIEDGGYTRERLYKASGGEVGVYVGSMYQEYQIFNGEQLLLGNPILLGGSAASIANRVSYFLDLAGPSITLDTMCSSALTAMYLACQDISSGKCKMAIAGGVNVAVHPNKYLVLSYENFLSSDGLCKSFGKDGDGYVPSEGVGAVLMKPLSDAIADKDQIYGVIKGIDINHGGKASGFTVPNSRAQAAAIRSALSQSEISPEDINYIEAHGTGTSLGDPLEISGLSQVFPIEKDPKKRTKIGSIKSNIGHCESAAGMAALSKVLLQIKHKKLVPSIHSDPPNPNIPFEKMPFVVQNSTEDWNAEKRTALISSFGAGGSNGCMVVQEHPQIEPTTSEQRLSKLFVLSAQNLQRLHQYVESYVDFFKKNKLTTAQVVECMYTLQLGREPFQERLAVVFDKISDLLELLTQYLNKVTSPAIFLSSSNSSAVLLNIPELQDEFQEFITEKLNAWSLETIAQLWVSGTNIDWKLLYDQPQHTMSLPTYPFNSTPCIFDKMQSTPPQSKPYFTHPLLHQNISTLSKSGFVTQLSQDEPLLRDHVIGGNHIFPGAAMVEMFYASAQLLCENTDAYTIKNLIWINTLQVSKLNSSKVYTYLVQEDKTTLSAQIMTDEGTIISQCNLVPLIEEPLPAYSLSDLKNTMDGYLNHDTVYAKFSEMGFVFGPTFKTLQGIQYSEKSFLAHVKLSGDIDLYHDCRIQPYFIDAMLQATIGLSSSLDLSIPFCFDQLIFKGSLESAEWIYGYKKSNSTKQSSVYDLFLLNSRGEALLCIFGFQDASFNRKPAEETDFLDEILSLVKGNKIDMNEAEAAIQILNNQGKG